MKKSDALQKIAICKLCKKNIGVLPLSTGEMSYEPRPKDKGNYSWWSNFWQKKGFFLLTWRHRKTGVSKQIWFIFCHQDSYFIDFRFLLALMNLNSCMDEIKEEEQILWWIRKKNKL